MSAGDAQPTHKLTEQYETLRRNMAQAILPLSPLAFSMDGRTFGYEAPASPSLTIGAYVSIRHTDGAEHLGQITTQEMAVRDGPEYGIKTTAEAGLLIAKSNMESNFVDRVRIRYIQGMGEIIGRVTSEGIKRTTTHDVFDNATLEPAPTETIALYLAIDGTAARPLALDVGYCLAAERGKARAQLQPQGFRRHTFMCGQSRSGKTFALGVILEQILLSENAPRIVVLDPNSDFVRLNEIRSKLQHDATRHAPRSDDEYTAIEARYRQCSPTIRILRPFAGNPPLRIRLSDLNRYEQGAVLQLHPINDLQAFNAFSKVIETLGNKLYSWQV